MPTQTKQKRNPRFRRVSTINFRLQDRDSEIIKHVYNHRFLSSRHIQALVPGSNQVILRRLQALYHSNYLDRPRDQITPYQLGNNPIIYGLGNKGADFLAEQFKVPRAKVDWTSKNRNVQAVFLYHTLLVSNFMVCLELACSKAKNVNLIQPDEILDRAPALSDRSQENPFTMRVHTTATFKGEKRKLTLGILPDKVFGLYFPQDPEGRNRAYFFLEADRATMPIMRKDLSKTSFYKKMLGYWASWQQGVFQNTFGFKNARVLTVTKSPDRIKSMIEAGKQADNRGKGSRMFLFTLTSNLDLNNPGRLLEKIWQNGRDNEYLSLFD